jgi:crotonobetainyl-CoA:carnitine CoA-transferase CaiB-like acyl-CoA transferase
VFCREFGAEKLKGDPRLGSNGQRVKERSWLIPEFAAIVRQYDQKSLARKLEQIGLPFAPIAKPWDLLDDPHLNAHGGLMEVRVGGRTIRVPALPLELDGQRLAKRSDPPAIGADARELLRDLGYSSETVQSLAANGIIRLP